MGNENNDGGTKTALTGGDNGTGNNTGTGTGTGSGSKSGEGGGGGTGTNPAKIVLPEKWQETLSDDLKNEPVLKQFTDFESLAKSLVHAQKAIGAEKIVIPGKNATESDWKEVYKKLGLPESKDKYELKAPEIFSKAKESIEQLKEIALEAGIRPQQMQKILDKYGEMTKSFTESQVKMDKDAQTADISNLKNEWGKAFDQNLKLAQVALKKFDANGKLAEILDLTGLGNHSALIKAFSQMGQALGEGSIDGAGSGSGGEKQYTPAEASAKIGEVMADQKHPYNDPQHPNHKKAVEDMSKIFEAAHPHKTSA